MRMGSLLELLQSAAVLSEEQMIEMWEFSQNFLGIFSTSSFPHILFTILTLKIEMNDFPAFFQIQILNEWQGPRRRAGYDISRKFKNSTQRSELQEFVSVYGR